MNAKPRTAADLLPGDEVRFPGARGGVYVWASVLRVLPVPAGLEVLFEAVGTAQQRVYAPDRALRIRRQEPQ